MLQSLLALGLSSGVFAVAHASDKDIKDSQKLVKLAAPGCFDGDAAQCAVVCEHARWARTWLAEAATKAGKLPAGPQPGRLDPGLAACDVACHAGDVGACFLGAGPSLAAPPSQKAALYMKACDLGAMAGCAAASRFAAEGHLPGVTAEDLLARVNAACDAGDAVACQRLGNLAFEAWVTSHDRALLARAAERWALACATDPVEGVEAQATRRQACRYALCVTGEGMLREEPAFTGANAQAWACEMEHMASRRDVGADLSPEAPEPVASPAP